MDLDEVIDLVQEDDQVIGTQKRSVVYANKMKNFRVINAFVCNSRQEIFIPKRSFEKTLFPGCLDCSVGGHVLSGETYDQALLRETEEELGIKPPDFTHSLIGCFNSYLHPVSAFMHLYLMRCDQPIIYNPRDFCEASWYSFEALKVLIHAKTPSKGDLPFLLNYLLRDYFHVDF